MSINKKILITYNIDKCFKIIVKSNIAHITSNEKN